LLRPHGDGRTVLKAVGKPGHRGGLTYTIWRARLHLQLARLSVLSGPRGHPGIYDGYFMGNTWQSVLTWQ
jgi:hypothetical protein